MALTVFTWQGSTNDFAFLCIHLSAGLQFLGQRRKIAAVNTAHVNTARIYQAQHQHHFPQLPKGLKTSLCSAFSALKAEGGGCCSLLELPHNSLVSLHCNDLIFNQKV